MRVVVSLFVCIAILLVPSCFLWCPNCEDEKPPTPKKHDAAPDSRTAGGFRYACDASKAWSTEAGGCW